ncbi:MAG: hypothetical protein LUF92_05395 [Clostridiales bacterium]|nr:hypothetical protein [Clostridiales bacterium]
MGFRLGKNEIREYVYRGEFGLEKESLRVNEAGHLAHTLHPFPEDQRISKDFCENQTELITGVHTGIRGVWEELNELQRYTMKKLTELDSGREYLWPFSNPPYVRGENDIPVAVFSGDQKEKEVYRNYLAGKYGKKKMLFSGIHFNFSFLKEMLLADYKLTDIRSYTEYKNGIYLELAEKLLKRSWLIVYLTAASPMMDGSFYENGQEGVDVFTSYASPRCSEDGYWNPFIPIFDCSSLDAYIYSIQKYVDNGQLRAPAELYYPIRLKPHGDNSLANLGRNGVNHIELRMLDLNPLSPAGIDKRDLKFIYFLILYLMLKPKESFEIFDQVSALRNIKSAALYEDSDIHINLGWSRSEPVKRAATEILDDMESRLFDYIPARELAENIGFQRRKVNDPSFRYAVRIREVFQTDYVKKGLELARRYADEI